ncbi:DUF4235 domain-containing protein [Nonomuraea sp. NEAU-A123]|uniref:DUF4235 domain-containing protein n=1 Tax=Nonomuraea sp. NEAU-A123 TaxID=2839649 RepID=UPI001BE4D1A5|nr:DUF4235 domain-containing protein [Nonomuraea sp. NEAU-A123]MBT2229800.1 DUF4235 domain-containing protein [Nonomuraea sp. NEAU-A123]
MTLLYKPLSLLAGVLGGMIAGMLFKQAWKIIAREDKAPDVDDPDFTWRQVLLSAMLQGAVFGLVKAAVQRAGARGVRKATGRWPGDDRRRGKPPRTSSLRRARRSGRTTS